MYILTANYFFGFKLHYSLWFEGYLSQTVTLDGIFTIGTFFSIKESAVI
jgi:hypothetical protein